MNILIAEDERIILDDIEESLISKGFNAMLSENGKEALEIFQTNRIHAIIVDNGMPLMSGEEFIAKVRMICQKVPIIVISGSNKNLDEYGIFCYLPKPFSMETILQKVKEAIVFSKYKRKLEKKVKTVSFKVGRYLDAQPATI